MTESRNLPFTLTTDAIDERAFFDPRYTCDADNSSPELRWDGVPANVVAFALLADDPDAPGGLFSHWVVYNIPVAIHHLPAGIPAQETLPNGIRQGMNGYGKLGYAGPCPPSNDRPHHYVFRLYALAAQPDLPTRATRETVLQIISPFILATAEVLGQYKRAAQRAG